MTMHESPQHDPPTELERRTADAFATVDRGAPALDRNAIWTRISPEVTAGRGRSNGWRATLQSLLTTRALTAAGVAAVAVVAATALTLSSGGGRADAALLQAARSLSSATDAALADGILSNSELDALRGDAEALLADIVADPAGLDRLSADDLAALATILNSLEDRLRTTEAATTAAFTKVESAAGLAASALRSSNPDSTLVTTSSSARDERFTVAAAGTQSIVVGAAGAVVIDVGGGTLTLVSTSPNPGWTVEVETASGREVEADFRNGSDRVKFSAELEDGVLRTRIETDGGTSTSSASSSASGGSSSSASSSSSSDDGSSSGSVSRDQTRDETQSAQAPGTTVTYDVPGAGFVIIFRTGDTLTISGTSANAGWTAEIETATGREVEADFRNGTARVKFNAELEDGAVRIRIEGASSSGSASGSASATPSSTSTPSSGGSGGSSSDDNSGSSGSGGGGSGSGNSGSDDSGSGNSGSGSSNSGSGSGS